MRHDFFTLSISCLLVFFQGGLVFGQAGGPDQNGRPQRPQAPNQTRNAGFEEGGESWSLKSAKVVVNQARSGKSSLLYKRSNPKQYDLVTQGNFKVEPGQVVRFSAYVKGEDITTDNAYALKGAGVYLQGYDASGKYINGAFPFCKTGTFDWSKVGGMYEVPDNVVRVTLGVYMRKGTTGSAWFDDVSMEIADAQPFSAYLAYPNYRGMTVEGSQGPWEACLEYNLPDDWGQARIESVLLDENDEPVFNESLEAADRKGEQSIFVDEGDELPEGDYRWKISLSDGENTLEEVLPIQVRDNMPAVYIDKEGFTVQNGERIFPFGVYLGTSPGKNSWASSPDNLERIKSAGFNTILSYYFGDQKLGPGYVKQAQSHGLNVIYSLKDIYDGAASNPKINVSAEETATRLANELKDAPNLLAWYTNDELGIGEVQAVTDLYEVLRESDPDHPVYQVNNKLDALKWYYPSTDVLGTDPYPVTHEVNTMRGVATWTQTTMDAARGTKGVWQVLQIHNKSFHKKSNPDRDPTLDEMRNMSYLAIIDGAKGLMYYAYHWLWFGRDASGKAIKSEKDFLRRWPDVQKMGQEVSQLFPVILRDEKVKLEASETDAVRHQAWRDGDNLVVVLVNPEPKNDRIRLQVPEGYAPAEADIRGMTIEAASGSLQVQLDPLASGVLVLERK